MKNTDDKNEMYLAYSGHWHTEVHNAMQKYAEDKVKTKYTISKQRLLFNAFERQLAQLRKDIKQLARVVEIRKQRVVVNPYNADHTCVKFLPEPFSLLIREGDLVQYALSDNITRIFTMSSETKKFAIIQLDKKNGVVKTEIGL